VIHPPAEIVDRIVKGKDNLRLLDFGERYSFLNWLYLAYNPTATGRQLNGVVDGHMQILRIIAAAERVFGPWSKTRDWLSQPNAELGEIPICLLATTDGQRRVADLLSRMSEQLSLEESRAIGDVLEADLDQQPGNEEIIDDIQALIAIRRAAPERESRDANGL